MGGVWLLSGLHNASGRIRMLALVWLMSSSMIVALLAGALERIPASIVNRLASIGNTPSVWNVADAEVNDATFSTIERVAHWEAAVSMFAERPWRGQGPGHYALAYQAHRLPRWSDALGHAHNTYLNFLAESGIPGLAGFLIWLITGFALALRAAMAPAIPKELQSIAGAASKLQANADPLRRALGLGLLGVLGSLATHAFLDNLFVHEMTVHLGLLLGLCLAAGATPQSGTRRQGPTP
jgi:putative inorganic carbon (HCO3(-)) transporter